VFNKQGNREPGWSRQSVRSHLSPTLICHLSVERARVFSAPSAWLPQNPQPRKPTSAVCPSKGPAGHRVDSLPPACPPRGAQAPSATPVSGDPAGVGIPGAERQPVAAIRPAYPSFILGQMKVSHRGRRPATRPPLVDTSRLALAGDSMAGRGSRPPGRALWVLGGRTRVLRRRQRPRRVRLGSASSSRVCPRCVGDTEGLDPSVIPESRAGSLVQDEVALGRGSRWCRL
jgi:hypothetical protein